jgi:hypothetical protein
MVDSTLVSHADRLGESAKYSNVADISLRRGSETRSAEQVAKITHDSLLTRPDPDDIRACSPPCLGNSIGSPIIFKISLNTVSMIPVIQ